MNIFKTAIVLCLVFGCATSILAGDSLSIEGFLSTKNIKAEKMLDGIFYSVVTEGGGETPRQGEFVKIRYVGKLLNGKSFDESTKDEPYVFQLGSGQVIPGWNKALQKLKIGTKVTLYIPAYLAYGQSGIGNVIPPNTPLVYDIEILGVLSRSEYDAHLHKLEDKQRKFFDNRVTEQFDTDKKHINDYALLHRLRVKRTESGLSYIVTKEGKADLPKKGSKITFNYEGMLLSDRVFDSTKDKEPATKVLGESDMVGGLEEGLKFFGQGAEGYLLIPSKLGFGATPVEDGKVNIPAHSVLIYKIQMVNVK